MTYIQMKLITQKFTVDFDSSNGKHEVASEHREWLEKFLKEARLDSVEHLSAIQWDPGCARLELSRSDFQLSLKAAGALIEE